MAFNGKLIQVKVNGTYTDFPMKYIQAESYKVTPNQRFETSANRSVTGVLVRQTVAHTASKVEFDTIPLTNKDINIIQTLLASAYGSSDADKLQRKLMVKYYNPSNDSYAEGTFYVPDIDYNIRSIVTGSNIINYNPVRYAFIEY